MQKRKKKEKKINLIESVKLREKLFRGINLDLF